ncbi:MAG: hypothetical protein KAW56_00955 [Candidatus Marinimicrobia bacterium]|nr:hypothetical protein [Candidatus Neomarinimicrobiota bacterium]
MDEQKVSPVIGLIRKLNAIRNHERPNPKSGSPAFLEMQAYQRPESLATFSWALIALESSSDHLEALDRLVSEGEYAVSPWTCARGLLESAAIATWLLDPNIDASERVSRSFALRYSSLCEQRKIARKEQEKVKIEKRINDIEKMALSLGFSRVLNRKDKRIGIGQQKPKITELVGNQFNFGKLYPVLSSIAHCDSIIVSQIAFSGDIIKQRAVPREVQQNLLANAVAVYTRGVWMHVIQFGYDAAQTAVVLEKCYNEINLADNNEIRFWRTIVGGNT